jgi:hypothetical protein
VAQPTVFLQSPIQRFFDQEGLPLAGGKVYSYVSGTSTPKALYTDILGETPFDNPIELPADGSLLAYMALDALYRIDVFDANDVHQPGWPVDSITGITVAGGGFTPVIAGSVVAGVGSYTEQSGIFVRSGPVVFFSLTLVCVGHTGSGNTRILGFPDSAIFDVPVTVLLWGGPGLVLAGPVHAFLNQLVNLEISLLTVDLSDGTLAAIPLADLAAVDEFSIKISGFYVAQ